MHVYACAEIKMAGNGGAVKKVLVCLGERKREISFISKDDAPDGNSLLKEAVKAFHDVLDDEKAARLLLQLKNEDWDGDYVDVVGVMSIPDKSVLKAIVVEPITPLKEKVSQVIT